MEPLQEFSYSVIRSNRKTVAVQFKPDGSVVLRVPKRMPQREIERLLREENGRILKRVNEIRASVSEMPPVSPLTEQERQQLLKEAKADFTARTARYAPLVGVSYGEITVRTQKSRWGSCSTKGNLNYNALLMFAPEVVRNYVVVHELCHRKHMDHSAAFRAEVSRVCPDCKAQQTWLKKNGNALMLRLPEKET